MSHICHGDAPMLRRHLARTDRVRMSNTSQGPGWWLASDGKWYPPELWTGPPPVGPAGAPAQSVPTYPANRPLPCRGRPLGGPAYGATATASMAARRRRALRSARQQKTNAWRRGVDLRVRRPVLPPAISVIFASSPAPRSAVQRGTERYGMASPASSSLRWWHSSSRIGARPFQ